MRTTFVLRRGPIALRASRRSVRVLLLLGVLLPILLLTSISLGEYRVPPADVARSLLGRGSAGTDFIVLELRLPRALAAVFAGGALGLAGAIFQEVTRNALVSPDVVGVSGGAAVGACAVIVLTPLDGPWAVPLAALAGALGAGLLLAALTWRVGVGGSRVVLVGIGLAALMHAAISYVLTQGRIFEVGEAYVWLIGTVNGRGWDQVVPLAAAAGVLAPAALLSGRVLDALVLGDDVARGLGAAVDRGRGGLLALATALTAAAVAATGPIGFVAFIAPHLARRLLRSASASALLPAAAAAGATLVVVADLAARLLFAPVELPVGLVTSILAAPYFLVLLRRAGSLGATG